MISRVVEGYSGIAVSPNEPIVGENVFTQVAGVHADGDKKDNLYSNALKPERFGRKREFALGKNSGKANIEKNLEELGMTLTPEQVEKSLNASRNSATARRWSLRTTCPTSFPTCSTGMMPWRSA